MPKRLLLGDEALAQGAIDAGLSGAYAYPGTPSTEITEYVAKNVAARDGGIHCSWTANEKTALEAAIGMSYAGKRAMASMKHVGLNVAADPFVNAAIAGAHGGLLINVADDPSMHSSQNEQDSRLYLDLALIPCIEPSDQQEAYEAPEYGFALSERLGEPVLVRLTTRLAHSRAAVELREGVTPPSALRPSSDRSRYILLPVNARKSYAELVRRQADFVLESERSPFNRYSDADNRSVGILACGIAHNYVLEAFNGAPPHPLLKIGQYPLPMELIERLTSSCQRVLVIEEGYPYVESKLRGLLPRTAPILEGRLTGHLPRTGELTPESVRQALGLGRAESPFVSATPAPRPPSLCPGCPHADTCKFINAALADQASGRVFSDIGCYTLGALPPFESIDTCLEMGASITMAKGASDAGVRPAVALIGDSTFTHSGMTGLLDCVTEGSDVTIIIVDNLTTAMTGGQPSAALSRLEAICIGLGVPAEHVRVLEPVAGNHDANVAVLNEEIAHSGPSVVISRRECIQTLRKRPKVDRPTESGEEA
jgi:indolepyruvate ferredoxin oxidoreductase alpha subunit